MCTVQNLLCALCAHSAAPATRSQKFQNFVIYQKRLQFVAENLIETQILIKFGHVLMLFWPNMLIFIKLY